MHNLILVYGENYLNFSSYFLFQRDSVKQKYEPYVILDYVVRKELKVFSNEVIRFGNRSKDPQWHNLDRYLEK